MFLSKRASTYYLFYSDEVGNRHKVSTHCSHKSDAMKFLQDFKAKEHEQRLRLQRIMLSQFKHDFLEYAKPET